MKLARSLPLLAALLASCVAVAAHAALRQGDAAPLFAARASLAGKAFDYSLKESLGKGAVVVYFYPAAFTSGCNVQAHAFAENIDRFAAAGASVVGVSLDGIDRLNDFSADPAYCAGKLPVASDPDGRIARAYELAVRKAVAGARDTRGLEIGHGFAERTTFVVARDGRIAATIGGVSSEENVKRALDAVRALSAAR